MSERSRRLHDRAVVVDCHNQIRIEGLRIRRTLWIARTRNNLDNPVAEAFIKMLRERQPDVH